MSSESLVEPTNREVIEHMHTLFQETLKCQLEGFKVVLNRLHAIDERLERIEAHAHAQGQAHV